MEQQLNNSYEHLLDLHVGDYELQDIDETEPDELEALLEDRANPTIYDFSKLREHFERYNLIAHKALTDAINSLVTKYIPRYQGSIYDLYAFLDGIYLLQKSTNKKIVTFKFFNAIKI